MLTPTTLKKSNHYEYCPSVHRPICTFSKTYVIYLQYMKSNVLFFSEFMSLHKQNIFFPVGTGLLLYCNIFWKMIPHCCKSSNHWLHTISSTFLKVSTNRLKNKLCIAELVKYIFLSPNYFSEATLLQQSPGGTQCPEQVTYLIIICNNSIFRWQIPET